MNGHKWRSSHLVCENPIRCCTPKQLNSSNTHLPHDVPVVVLAVDDGGVQGQTRVVHAHVHAQQLLLDEAEHRLYVLPAGQVALDGEDTASEGHTLCRQGLKEQKKEFKTPCVAA